MRELLRDYGAAIGPALAFILGLLALFAKDAIERYAARRNAGRRLKKIVAMMRMSPPPAFQGPIDALSNATFMLTNAVNMSTFYDRMTAIHGALDAADKVIHEHGKPDLIIKFQRMRWHMNTILQERQHFRKMTTGSDIPIEENFLNARGSWQAFVESDSTDSVELGYQVARP